MASHKMKERVFIDTVQSTFTLDFDQLQDRQFIGTAAFTGSKTIALKNDGNAMGLILDISVTTSCALTFPNSFTAETTETRFASKVLTLTGTGNYTIVALFNGTTWRLKASADGGFA